jgi:16S rRNA C967 or C1407 C5-methylase (RsmB/RsmF family)/NOL1/NOP2/fmu family ribosome biogenesis protein
MFPAEFINDLRDSLGVERADRLLAALSAEPEVSVRVNPDKLSLTALREHFGALAGDPVPWAADEAFYLTERPSFTLDPLFHAGAYYVQEASSMYVGKLFEQAKAIQGKEALRVLDLCAAPGGKTTQLLSHLDDTSLLVANEVVPSRATILAENVARWGRSNVAVTQSDPAAFGTLRGFFDIAVVDAPCSGEGMFRKDERAVTEWSPANVELCAARQRRILADFWPSLWPGGFLIYSTCTFNRQEDEDNVDWICRELGAEYLEMRHFYPGEDRGEGFFAALLRKSVPGSWPQNGCEELQRHSMAGRQRSKPDSGTQDGYKIVESHSVAMLKQITRPLAAALPQLEKSLRVIASGTAVATRKGRDLVPEADYALAVERTPLEGLSYAIVEVSREEALKFLSKESLVLPDAPRGYLLLTHAGLGLGFVKNLGTRTNSLLPNNRRIRMRE